MPPPDHNALWLVVLDESDVVVAVRRAAAELHIAGVGAAERDMLLFDDLGFDSFDVIDLLLLVEDLLSVRVPEESLMVVYTYGDLIDAVVNTSQPFPPPTA